jgi:hypothetical protein
MKANMLAADTTEPYPEADKFTPHIHTPTV